MLGICPLLVLPMHHLTHQPEIGVHGSGDLTQFLPEIVTNMIRCVQSQAIDTPFLDPEAYGLEQICANNWVCQVKFWQCVVSCPGQIVEEITHRAGMVEAHPLIPIQVFRMLSILLKIMEGEKITSAVIKDRIQDQTNPSAMDFIGKGLKGLVRAQPSIDLEIVGEIIAMRAGLQDGS